MQLLLQGCFGQCKWLLRSPRSLLCDDCQEAKDQELRKILLKDQNTTKNLSKLIMNVLFFMLMVLFTLYYWSIKSLSQHHP